MQHHTLPLFAAGIVVAAVCSAAMLTLVGAWCWRERRRERGVGAAADGLQVQEGEHNTDGRETVLIGRGGSSFESGLGADSSKRIDAEQQGVQVGLSGGSCTGVLQLAAAPYTCWQGARSYCCLALPHPHPHPPTTPLAQNAGRPDPRHGDPRVGSTFH